MDLFKTLLFISFLGLTGVSYAEVSVQDKQKFGSYYKPVKVHNQAEFDYIHLLLSYMGVERDLKLLNTPESNETQKIIKVDGLCKSIGFSYSHADFIALNKQFSKNVKYDSQEKIGAQAKKFGVSPNNCQMVKDYIRKNPEEIIGEYIKNAPNK